MNRAAVGLGSWLVERRGERQLALEDELAGWLSFMRWQKEEQASEGAAEAEAFSRVLRELWHDALTPEERKVLQAVDIAGTSEAAAAEALGIGRTKLRRLRREAEEKLKGGLRCVMRYRELLRK